MRLFAIFMFTATLTTAAELNHFYLVLDHQTYADIGASEFLKSEFGTFEQRTIVRTDMTYTASYFYGTHTYFEFFGAPNEKRTKGESGIAFGVDTASSEPASVPLEKRLTTREWQGVQLPWFYQLSSVGKQGLVAWLMEYHPDFLEKWHPAAGGASASITREAVLRRYKAVLPKTPAEVMLEDVIALTIAASPEERQPVEQWIRNIGSAFPVQFLDPKTGEHGVCEVRFKLRRAAA